MRRVFMILFLTNMTLFAEEKQLIVDNSMPWMTLWLIASLSVIGLLFWSIYKAMKTKNPKYGWGMGLSILLMVVLLFR